MGTNATELQVGFIGVGQMGRPMVDRMTSAGVPVEVYVRRPDQRAELAAAGIPVATSASALAGAVDLLIICVFDESQVRSVLLDGSALQAMQPGAVLVSHVTGGPTLSLDLQAAAPDGVTVLDVPISGTADDIRRGQLTAMVGGEPRVLERVRAVLGTYSDPILHVGALGDGQRAKLLNNLLFAVNLRMALLAAALGEAMGLEPTELARVVSECSGGSFALDLLRDRDPTATAQGVRPYLVKDVRAIVDVASEQGLDLGLLGELAKWVFEP